MTEKPIRHTLSISELELLSDLVGQQLQFVGGENLDVHALAESIVVATESNETKILIGLVDDKFEGFEDEYPVLGVVKASTAQKDAIERLGNFNVTFAGSVISDVSLVRDVINCRHLGSTIWSLETDMGLVIHLGQAAISFVNLTDYDIVGKLAFHPRFDPSELPSAKTLQENDLVNTYEVSRGLVSLPNDVKGD